VVDADVSLRAKQLGESTSQVDAGSGW